MRNLLVLLVIVALAPPNTSAVVDPNSDGFGVYFDLDADVYQTQVPPSVPFYAYAILTNPTGAEINGYEFSRIFSAPTGMEGMLFMLDRTWHGYNDVLPVEPPDLGGNVMIELGVPLPASPAVVLVTWWLMILAPMEVVFYLGPSTGEFGTNGQLVYESETGLVPMHVSSGDPAFPVATVNGSGGVIPVTSTSFGALKATFR